MAQIVLASTSAYRRRLLERILPEFVQAAPDCDETPKPGERPDDLVRRLSIAKALSVAATHPHSLIIGSDQIGWDGQQMLTKPGSIDAASHQLRCMAGKTLQFLSGVSIVEANTGRTEYACAEVSATLRTLSESEIHRYLLHDTPLDCAGSFKIESLGIALFTSVASEDPTALEGLPLITVSNLLRCFGVNPLTRWNP